MGSATACEELETYLSRVKEDVPNLDHQRPLDNLSPEERRAITKLRKNTDITIKKADKGSAIVVEDTAQYILDGKKHLSDTTAYKIILEDPTPGLVNSINRLTREMHQKGFIDHHTRDYLLLEEPVRTQHIYFLKKLHKNPIKVRPIVSGCSGPTEKLSEFMDHHLKPLVRETKSYIRDSKSLISILEGKTLPHDIILATIDVKSLYTNPSSRRDRHGHQAPIQR